MITSLKLTNFQLFRNAEITFDNINAITGVNLDNPKASGNGSGKSTIAKNAITFALYGEVTGLSLVDLISDAEKETEVTISIKKLNDNLTITRKIPSELLIKINGVDLDLNTLSLKQKWINDNFGTYDYFRKYRLIDLKGTNLLDSLNDSRGIVTLKNELMKFIDDLFVEIRKSLLAKKLDRETYNVDKRLYKFSLSEKRLNTLEEGIEYFEETLKTAETDEREQAAIVNKIKSEVMTKQGLITQRQRQMEEAQKSGFCPILKKKCLDLVKELTPEQRQKVNQDIAQLSQEAEQFSANLEPELGLYQQYADNCTLLRHKKQRIQEHLMKLKEAFKFSAYKYTAKDVALYGESIKTLDAFASTYINDWLGQLAIIINNLLKNVNLQIEFTPDKDFMRVYDTGKPKKYAQLSSGQKAFLSSIFKMSILIHRGENSGLIIADEGFDFMDKANLESFVEVCQSLNFQIIFVYQNLPQLNNVKIIQVERKDGESEVK